MYDYLIVGGGSAGCVLAARLSEDPDVRVALLEAGEADRSALIHCPAGIALMARTGQANWAFETVAQSGLDGRAGYQPRGKVLGGSSSINAMIYIRGQREDYDAWAAAGNPGWGWADVLPYFKRSEHNERGADAWHGAAGPLNVMDLPEPNPWSRRFIEAGRQAGFAENRDFNGEHQEGVGMYQVTHRGGERFSAAKAYLTPALDRPNLDVVTGAQVLKVVLEGCRATGVELLQGGTRRVLAARREVILSAGALQSPQLLLLSGIGPGAELQALGVPVVHDLPGVGRHLHDHPDVVLLVDAPGAKETVGVSAGGALRVLAGVQQWRSRRRGLLTTNFAESGAFLRTRADEMRPDVQLHFVIGKLVDHGRSTVWGHGWSAHVCVLRPQSRGRVTLRAADPLAPPRIDPGFLDHPDDLRRLMDGVRLTQRILAQPALAGGGRPSAAGLDDTALEHWVRQHADTIYHPVGSCRMGPGRGDVVDAELRVKGIQGLRVADASIMPSIVSGNTNAPTLMIGEKAADLVRRAAALV
ncbi:GMC family oxidoreductase [Rubrivivax sp. JA1026]|uniref:GMC family oxidoreductase n=1 Tax=Rubrivivax sp. JA1026 TaxID=2710888 RepID=UPI0013E93794|nr:GMC family oxidoreductase N-terminal domain-containing protein [Rubrivivax sp. JA1026]